MIDLPTQIGDLHVRADARAKMIEVVLARRHASSCQGAGEPLDLGQLAVDAAQLFADSERRLNTIQGCIDLLTKG